MTDREIIAKLNAVYYELVERHGEALRCYFTISFSTRFQTKAGDCRKTGFNSFRIRLSRKLLNQFGYERIEKTFRHELAHVYCFKRGIRGHCQSFKRVCNQFGGSMNSSMAGWQFKDSASTEYTESNREFKYKYTCNGCGKSFKYKRKMSSRVFNNPNRRCTVCRTPTTNFTEEHIG